MPQSQGSPLPRVPTHRSRVRLRHRLLFLLLFLLGPSAQRHLPQLRGPGSRAWGAQGDQDLQSRRCPGSRLSPGCGGISSVLGAPGCSPAVTKGCLGAPCGCCCCCCWWSCGERGQGTAESPSRCSEHPQRQSETPTAAGVPQHSKAPPDRHSEPPMPSCLPTGQGSPSPGHTPAPQKGGRRDDTGDTSSVLHPQHPVNHPAGQGVWGSLEHSGDKGRDKGPGSGGTPRG